MMLDTKPIFLHHTSESRLRAWFNTMFCAGVSVFLFFFRKKKKFTEDCDPEFTQLSDWTALFCTGVPGIMPSTLAGIDFMSLLPLFT